MDTMSRDKREEASRRAFGLSPYLVTSALLLFGVVIGICAVILPFRMRIMREQGGETLGKLLTGQRRTDSRLAYYDSTNALAAMDDFSWSVHCVPTPFIGAAPSPGPHHNAFINSFQFRTKNEPLMPKPETVFRIFITGGSTAYGSGAPSQDATIGAYLESILRRDDELIGGKEPQVLTAANAAWASTHERILIENRLSELDPDLVLSLSGNNDVHWGYRGKDILWFRTYQEEGYWKLLYWLHRVCGLGHLVDVVKTESSPMAPKGVAERLHKNVSLSAHALSLQDTPYVFLLQPTIAVTDKPLSEREQELVNPEASIYHEQCHAEIKEALSQIRATNYTFMDLSSIFDHLTENDEVFLDSYHFGDRGNEIVAQAIYQRIAPMIRKAIN